MKLLLFHVLVLCAILASCSSYRNTKKLQSHYYEYSLAEVYVNSLDYSKVEWLKIDATYFDTSWVELLKKCSNVKSIKFIQERGELTRDKIELFNSGIVELDKLSEVSILFDSMLFVPPIAKDHSSIEKLSLSGYYIRDFDVSAFSSTHFESIHLNVKVIDKTEVNFSECPNLLSLFVSTETNPSFNFKNLNRLESFQLANNSIENLPREIYSFENLKTLILSTPNVKGISNDIGKLSGLQFCMLNDCCQLVELPDSLGNLSQLSSLTIRNAPRIEKIPASYSNLRALLHFSIEASNKLTSIQPITQISSIQRLTMIGVDPIPVMEDLLQMENLTYLRVSLNTLCNKSKEELKAFETLTIEELHLEDRIFTIDHESNACIRTSLEEEKSIETYRLLRSILPKRFFK